MSDVRVLLAFALAAVSSPTVCAASTASVPSQPYFRVRLATGDAFENIFERTRYLTAPHRVSGYATYVITSVSGNRFEIRSSFSYYGRIARANVDVGIELRPEAEYQIFDGKASLATDSSGPFFNPWIWGQPPSTLAAGQMWHYRIPQAWELGPPGMQTIRILSLDPTNDRIVLQKTGSGIGAPLGSPPPIVNGVATRWGATTWKGIAIVRRGLIESEQIAVHHELIASATATRPRRTFDMIEQIELGQTPYDERLP